MPYIVRFDNLHPLNSNVKSSILSVVTMKNKYIQKEKNSKILLRFTYGYGYLPA